MTRQLRPALALLLLFTLLLGIVYPLALVAIGQALMPYQANGSLVRDGGRVVGSALIGQAFTRPGYFHGRPSAAGQGYDPTASSGSNFGPASRMLIDRTRDSVAAARADGVKGPIPADLVTASGSGLDPELSPEAALAQAARIAAARHLPPAEVRALVQRNVRMPALGFIGEPRVNVLALNRQLDRMGAQFAQ
ncbi:MAG: potassium-transporting ATPase KdpC subunit [Sphingomonadales bacterium]|jgi:K+-transporting ATPase ATPase C chain|nr:potassium-transporting ATPase KdpC subunit [Sphingomonadales bacterium]